MTKLRDTAGQRDVDRVGGAPRGGQLRIALGNGGLDVFLQFIGALAEQLLLVGGRGLERLHEGGRPTIVAAQPARAQRLQGRVGTSVGQLGAEEFPRLIWADGWIDGSHGVSDP